MQVRVFGEDNNIFIILSCDFFSFTFPFRLYNHLLCFTKNVGNNLLIKICFEILAYIDYLIKFAHEPHFNIYDVTYENIADTMTAKNVVSDVGVQSSS